MQAQRRDWLKYCVTVGAALVVLPALAIARPRFEQYEKYEMSVNDRTHGFVFDLHATRKDPHDTTPPFISKASMRVSPRLCEGSYQMRFAFTPVRGRVVKFPYPVRIRSARLDGRARRCPLHGLPSRGLRSLQVTIFVHNKILLRFSARPSGSAGETFKSLRVPVMSMYQSTAPGGRTRMQLEARFARASHRIELLADTKPPR